MNAEQIREALADLARPRGPSARILQVAGWPILLEGLDVPLAEALDRRWAGFVASPDRMPAAPRARVQVRAAGAEPWLIEFRQGSRYRVEGAIAAGLPLVRSHYFALCPESPGGPWICGLADPPAEPADRALENAVRYLVARCAVEDGGFALHAAGVVRGGRAFLFAGPSRAGKSTVVSLSEPCRCLGDDFALAIPVAGGWAAPAVPFDNRETAPEASPGDLFPLEGIWRLFQSPETRVDRLPEARSVASLVSCVAMAPAIPDRAAAILEHVRRFVSESTFGHLHFRRTAEFWSLIDPSGA